MTEQPQQTPQTREGLMLQALKERMAQHVTNYEEAIANLRANYTMLSQQVEAKNSEINAARAEVETLRAENNMLQERINDLENEAARPKRTTRKQKEDTAE